MKLKKTLSALAASVLMACSGISAVSANAAEAATATAVSLNAQVATSAKLVGGLDSLIRLRRTMPIKGDINGDKKVTVEDTTVLEVYLKGLISINKNSTAYRVLDVNWDGKLDSADLSLMPSNSKFINVGFTTDGKVYLPISPLYPISYRHSGDFNGDGAVNSKDLTILKTKTNSNQVYPLTISSAASSAITYPLLPSILFRYSEYDLNQDGVVNSKDVSLLDSYISYPLVCRLY